MKFRARSIIKTAATAALVMFVLCTCVFADATVTLPVGKLSDALRILRKRIYFVPKARPINDLFCSIPTMTGILSWLMKFIF